MVLTSSKVDIKSAIIANAILRHVCTCICGQEVWVSAWPVMFPLSTQGLQMGISELIKQPGKMLG